MTHEGSVEETGGIDDPATRRRLTPHATAGFLGVADRWRLSVEEQQALLGGLDRATLMEWRRPEATAAPLSVEVLTRISLVLAIYEAIERVLRDAPAEVDAWVRRPNADSPFGGRPPLDVMRAGGLAAVRAYVEQWTGGPPIRETRPSGET